MSSHESEDAGPQDAAGQLTVLLHSRSYLSLLMLAALLGIPISAIAFFFLAAVHQLEHVVWATVPDRLGFSGPPAWWPLVTLGVAGVLVALCVARLPGRGGHVPAAQSMSGATPTSHVPGVALAALASLTLGAVVGPEAPLIAIGGGLALILTRSPRIPQPAVPVIAAIGSAAAIAAIFGNPLVAAVLFLEVAGLARRQALLITLPCLIATGIGALIFTGLGDWTGLGIGALAIPNLHPTTLVGVDLVWALPIAAVMAALTAGVFAVGRRTAAWASARPMLATVVAGLVAGASATVYAVATDHSPDEIALSGQATLPVLATDPGHWSTGALIVLLAAKALAYGVCLGAFRGGPVFPAIFLGGALGILADRLVPGIGAEAGLAIGMAAGAAATRLPITGVLLVVLLLGTSAAKLMPIIILAVVTAIVVDEMLSTARPAAPAPESAAASEVAGS